MLPIYICDDNKELLEKMTKYVKTYLTLSYEFSTPSIYTYSDPHDFIDHMDMIDSTGIYILDIDFKKDISGLDLAEEIRLIDPLGFIVFVTTYEQYIPETYSRKIGAINYILKDEGNLEDQIAKTLCSAFNRYQSIVDKSDIIPEILCLNINRAAVFIEQNHILKIETIKKKHGVLIYHGSSITKANYSLAEIYEMVDKKFFVMCNRSQLVNIMHIKQVDATKRTLTFKNGDTYDISRRNVTKIFELMKERGIL